MTEQKKMLAGKIYDPSDGTLGELRTKAHRLCLEYNSLPGDSADHRGGCPGASSGIVLTFKNRPCSYVSKGDLFIPLPAAPPVSRRLFRRRIAPLPPPGRGG